MLIQRAGFARLRGQGSSRFPVLKRRNNPIDHLLLIDVSGGGRDFMRGFSRELYGIPRERVIGSTVAYRYVDRDVGGEIVQKAELDVIDDGPGKPIQIWNVIGRRPILAAGNSNGDIEMLKFAQGSDKPHLNLLLLHDDQEREFAYERGAENALNIFLGLSCSPCVTAYNHRNSPCDGDNLCLKNIKPDEVLARAFEILGNSKVRG